MKLLYDVLKYQPEDIKRVVLFATNNALVCETPEDAMRVAYDIEPQHRYDVSITGIKVKQTQKSKGRQYSSLKR